MSEECIRIGGPINPETYLELRFSMAANGSSAWSAKMKLKHMAVEVVSDSASSLAEGLDAEISLLSRHGDLSLSEKDCLFLDVLINSAAREARKFRVTDNGDIVHIAALPYMH